jgi:hypothetical protein
MPSLIAGDESLSERSYTGFAICLALSLTLLLDLLPTSRCIQI